MGTALLYSRFNSNLDIGDCLVFLYQFPLLPHPISQDVEMCMVSVPCDITCLEYSCPVGQSLLADAANILCESSTCTVVDCCLPDPVPGGCS